MALAKSFEADIDLKRQVWASVFGAEFVRLYREAMRSPGRETGVSEQEAMMCASQSADIATIAVKALSRLT